MKKLAVVLCLVAIAVGGLTTYSLALASGDGSTCPGKVVCPITGDEVCQDECPLNDANRADCPGKVECPLTAELVCSDECPLGLESAVTKPSCCTGSK
ncbi:hypothetical protein [Aeoliella sp.]|uniref:hypothetical protein n=1 Tax=Aeoliella sp. TaxID=2795800 RepID=UPI003CCC1D84